ncbi:DnaJ C-terminal domain-containing protein [Alkalimarinus alittae]|uniref:DnaJ domain-containing protein n=1 Tax=Alkalimarinus alittae TaxID=2961619 RepID=A0ABY6MZP7_9ALTE|nr:DnaJ C-terminal domain-containing protein [Alkalimarinus alittae]UZE95315.1 DnaJ domain-containing protein [Alkalimarinus alittae]
MEFKDYYKILGVKPDAEAKDIKTAYRKLARKYHPDMNPDEGAEDKFKEVAEAYEVLKDTARRAEFDELRKYGGQSRGGFQPPPGWQQSGGRGHESHHFEGDFSDFFNAAFGGGRQSGFRDAGQHTRGQDVEIEMPVFLEETLADNVKTVEYQLPVFDGRQVENIKKRLKVTIPKGVSDGERIRVKGQGKPGTGNGAAGDLYLHIRLVPHPLFDVQGHDLVITLPVTPWEAALGVKVTVPTLEGSINVTITPNSPSGKKLRIKGKGLKGKRVTGDLYAILKVVMPTTSNEKSNELWRQLSEVASFDPRAEWSAKK